jgi:hypothetical protein
MGTTRETISGWLKRGKEKGATHVIVACDTFSYSDFPVFVMPGEDVKDKCEETRGKHMQKIMEVYNLSMDLEQQLNSHRAFNY